MMIPEPSIVSIGEKNRIHKHEKMAMMKHRMQRIIMILKIAHITDKHAIFETKNT